MEYDALIIGGGVIGAAIAWRLSRYAIRTCLLEKENDLAEGTSKANSGIVHAGYDPEPGSLKASLNVRGNKLLHELSGQLAFDFVPNGAMVAAFAGDDTAKLEELYQRGIRNGVPGMRIIGRDEVLSMEGSLNPEVRAALYLPTSAIVCPFSLTYAFAENARDNGVTFRMSEKVLGIARDADGFTVRTGRGQIRTRLVVNAAGVYADSVHNMVADEKIAITPRRGEYLLLDKSEKGLVRSTIFQLPTQRGKGVLVTPTVHGNILCGPDSVLISDKEDTSTDADGLGYVMEYARKTAPSLDFSKTITSFTGLRAHPEGDDFIIGMTVPGFIDAAGMESPGLSASPAVGEMVGEIAADYLRAKKKDRIVEVRKAIPRPSQMDAAERSRLIASDPLYGNIICRCEEVSEGEIAEAVRRGAVSLDGVKRRVRAGMGRCQGGFCMPRVMEIISREAGIPMEDICKNGKGSEVLA